MNKPVIRLKNIYYSINSKTILNDISIGICKQGITGIIGPSGSGKSTLLRILNRLISPDSGSLEFKNKDYNDISPNLLRKQIGLVNQKPYLFEGTVEDNLMYGPSIWDVKLDTETRLEILNKSGLDSGFLKREAGSLSGGEQQRVNLARTLANSPEVILLDEPTSNLDFVSEEIIENTLKQLHSEGIKIIIVTHSLEQTRRLTDCLLFMKEGKVLEYTKTESFFKDNDPETLRNLFKKTERV